MTEQSSSQPSTQAQGATAGGHPVLERLRGGLIASAQAYPGEPMRDPRTMDQVAQACVAGGAVGIRAQGLADLALICQHVDVPVIGLWKDGHDGVFITPTLTHAIAVAATGSQIVALDGTRRPRPDGLSLTQTVEGLRAARPEVLIMADCGSLDDAKAAQDAGVDILGTTLAGYTGSVPRPTGPTSSSSTRSPASRRSRSWWRAGSTRPRRRPPPWSTALSPSSSEPPSPTRRPSPRGSPVRCPAPCGRNERKGARKRRRSATRSACDGCDCCGVNVRIVTRYPARHSGLT